MTLFTCAGVSEAGAFEEPRLPTADELDPIIVAAEATAAINPINSAAIYIDNCVKRVQSRTDRAVNALQDSIAAITSSLSASRSACILSLCISPYPV